MIVICNSFLLFYFLTSIVGKSERRGVADILAIVKMLLSGEFGL